MAAGEVRVAPVSELTERTVSLFMFELDEAVASGRTVVVDLRDVTTVAPSALHAIAEASRYLRDHDGELRIENPSARVRRLLEDLGFGAALRIEAAA